MRIPQAPERIKEAPAQALRAVFAGVGQVLLMTERIRRRALGQEHPQVSATKPVPAKPSTDTTAKSGTDNTAKPGTATTAETGTTTVTPAKAGIPAPAKTTTRTPAKTTKRTPAKATAPTPAKTTTRAPAKTTTRTPAKTTTRTPAKAKTPAPAEAAAPTPAEVVTPAPTTSPAGPARSEVRGTGTLPVPHYSELSIASLRARLRGLDIAQIRDLLAYERTHEDRANVIAMFERRIAKLEETEGGRPAAG
jgi:hypothetical protein